ncbi:GNAT family N-acyltransferase [Planktotalea sp.]|uniref:GNAT family N-acetyltransferase n=1 Tax=Planktotalea sp. TaxID=2029877 RepID=UPI003297E88F
MTVLLQKGRFRVRQSRADADIAKAQELRAIAFGCSDADAIDPLCTHVLVEDTNSGEVLSCFRMLQLDGKTVAQSYSAQFYELSALEAYEGVMVEMGRFCTHPDHANDPDLLRCAWGAMTAYVDAHNVGLLFGCSSYAGTDTDPYLDSFAMLKERHLGPRHWLPRIKAPKVFRFAKELSRTPDIKAALRKTPPLLRTYLMMGGWVSDHAVVDDRMNTLHVFTGVEIRAIPSARKRLLRAVAG